MHPVCMLPFAFGELATVEPNSLNSSQHAPLSKEREAMEKAHIVELSSGTPVDSFDGPQEQGRTKVQLLYI